MNSEKVILNIAHRGYSEKYPENTLRAFEEAFRVGADAVECDLRITGDGEVVAFHDLSLRRMCGLRKNIENISLHELKQGRVKKQYSVPTLEEILTHFPNRFFNLEVKKTARSEEIVKRILQVIKKTKYKGRIVISSFSIDVLTALHEHRSLRTPIESAVILESAYLDTYPRLKELIEPDFLNVTLRSAKKLSDNSELYDGLPIMAWTLNLKSSWRQACQLPINLCAIISDRTEELRQFLETSQTSDRKPKTVEGTTR